jgi:ATP-binding cassette subfamily F protein 3
VLDEPTNHLDIDSREALEDALAVFDGTVLAVSHDRYFMDKLATRVLALRPETSDPYLDYQVTQFGRGYTEYLSFAAARAVTMPKIADEKGKPLAGTGKAEYLARKQNAAEERKERARIARLKKEAEALENELAAIEEELFGSAASDYTRAAALDARKTEAEERLLEIYEEIGV